ncbi:murein biosynthesis integral membrane protein MurJ [Pseudonocardia lutea]|uniref:Murein biosynthesis integral membrane protein MurJ n=1 Tax=Pseudonocardia lutea TaxID=2172015 RepID=A0ABW1IES1_9PSEU
MRIRRRSERAAEPDGLSAPTGAVGDSVVVASWTMVSRMTGFVRVAVTAAVLGPTYFGNTYQATNALPNIVYYGLLAGSLMSSLLVPALVGHIDHGRRAACERLGGGVLGLSLLGVASLLPVAFLAAPLLLQLTALGSVAAADAEQQERIARLFLLLLLPQVFLYAVVACSAAVMNAHRRFALPAGAPAVENLGSIAVLVATGLCYPVPSSLSDIPLGEILLLGLGTTAAVGLHAALQWYGARRTGIVLRPALGWRDAEVKALVRRSLPALLQAALEAVQLLCVLFVANRVAGGVIAYQVAQNFFFLPLALGATPVALSLLPRLSRLHQRNDDPAFRDTTVRGLRFALFVAAPAAAVLAVLCEPLALTVSYGRMVADGGDALVAAALLALAPGVVAETAFLVTIYASYARSDTRSPLVSTTLKTATCLALLAVAMTVHGAAVVAVVGLAVSAAAIAGATHRVSSLLSGLPGGRERLVPSALRTLASAVVMAGPLWVGAHLLSGATDHRLVLAGTAVTCLVGGAAYLGVQCALRAPEAAWLLAALRRRRRDLAVEGAEVTR